MVSSVLRGGTEQLQYVNPPFVIDYARGERIYTSAPFQLREWRPPGDGTYVHNSSVFFARVARMDRGRVTAPRPVTDLDSSGLLRALRLLVAPPHPFRARTPRATARGAEVS